MLKSADAYPKVAIANTMFIATVRSWAIQYKIIVQRPDYFIAADGCQFDQKPELIIRHIS